MPAASDSELARELLLPSALVAALSVARRRAKGGPPWQYHSRSDHHSKVSCLLMQLDLMIVSPALSEDVRRGRVACGINHVMQDHGSNRKKAFDLVLHRPDALDRSPPDTTFRELLRDYGVVLSPDQLGMIEALPEVPVRGVPANGVYVAWEAKAAMTEFGKARPRLFDELNSSHLTIHADTPSAIAAGLVMVNAAETFVSPLRNPKGAEEGTEGLVVTKHRQPNDLVSVVQKIDQLGRRPAMAAGFDALGIVAIECRNDGTPVRLVTEADYRGSIDKTDLQTFSNFDYGRMIRRVAHLYETQFHRG